MKVIDRLSCPEDYTCKKCKNYRNDPFDHENLDTCVKGVVIDIIYISKPAGDIIIQGLKHKMIAKIPRLKNKLNHDYCEDYEPLT